MYALTMAFPKHEIYSLSNQMRRAAVSVPSNISEGHERHHLAEYLQHLSIALGSLAELETQIEISRRLAYLPGESADELLSSVIALAKQVRRLRESLQNPPSTQHPAPSTGAERLT